MTVELFVNSNEEAILKKGISQCGFVQLGQDLEAIIDSAYPGFGFGGSNPIAIGFAGLLLVNFDF